ncbi:hypothetical protein BC940DRAFT_298450 [Gongronella butleri]|nr:hypothetical protein BC940DRAFT_298450 [Gongronella butleri]
MASCRASIDSFRAKEDLFFARFSGARATEYADCALYGEVAFCMAGLKPCVLVDLDRALVEAYLQAVVLPWIDEQEQQEQKQEQENPQRGEPALWRVVRCVLDTPEMRQSPAVFVAGPRTSRRVDQALMAGVAYESQLATLLDYPGGLPEDAAQVATMLEVVYVDRARDNKLMTTFACQQDEQHNVVQHFQRYRHAMAPYGIDLALMMRRPV